MITEEEKEEIILAAVERAYLGIPELIGNLMTQKASLFKLNQKLYKDNPDFKDHKEAVMSVIEQVEGENPLAKYEDIHKKAIPRIRERINTIKNLNTDKVSTSPNRQFERIESPKIEPHGEI